jgi:hypothetical protein
MATHTKNVYVFFLENEKWLLHPSTTQDEYYILLECYLMYDFAKTNLPIRLFETLTITDDLEVDLYVKKYMRCYGIENVRGGSFVDEYLSSIVATSLEKELTKDYYKTPTLIEKITRKYESIQHWRPQDIKLWRTWRNEYDFTEDPKTIQDVMTLEKQHLKKEWTRFDNIQYLFQSLTYCSESINLASNDFTNDVEWLKTQILSESTDSLSNDEILLYKRLLVLFHDIKSKFLVINDELPIYEKKCYIKTPQLIFDTFIYHRNDVAKIAKEKKCALEVFEVFEYIFNVVSNKIEDYRFSLTLYPEDFEEYTRLAIGYIDYTYFPDTL